MANVAKKEVVTKKAKTTKKTKVESETGLVLINKLLADIPEEKQEDVRKALVDRIADFRIEANAQIALVKTLLIPKLERLISEACDDLKGLEGDVQLAYEDLRTSSYEAYLDNINERHERVCKAKAVTDRMKESLDQYKEQIARHEDVIARFDA